MQTKGYGLDTFFSDAMPFACFVLVFALIIVSGKRRSTSSGDGGGGWFDASDDGGCDGGEVEETRSK